MFLQNRVLFRNDGWAIRRPATLSTVERSEAAGHNISGALRTGPGDLPLFLIPPDSCHVAVSRSSSVYVPFVLGPAFLGMMP